MKHLLLVALAAASMVGLATAQDSPEPSDLANLRAGWQRARQQAVIPVDRKYLDALKALKLRLTKAGNLEQALAVEAEIQAVSSVTGDLTPEPTPKPVTAAELRESKWNFVVPSTNWMDVWTFTKDGRIVSQKNVADGHWSIRNRTLRAEFKGNTSWCEFSLEGERAAGGTIILKETASSKERKPGGTLTRF